MHLSKSVSLASRRTMRAPWSRGSSGDGTSQGHTALYKRPRTKSGPRLPWVAGQKIRTLDGTVTQLHESRTTHDQNRITMEPSRWRRHDIVSFARGLAGTEWDPRFEMFSGGELFHLFLERDVSTGRLMYSMCRDRVLYVIRERPSLREALDLEIDRRMAEIRGVRWVDPTKRSRDEEGLGAFCGPLAAS